MIQWNGWCCHNENKKQDEVVNNEQTTLKEKRGKKNWLGNIIN